MVDFEKLPKEFLAGWLQTLMNSIDKNLDETSKNLVLSETGNFCAEAHSVALFKEIKLKTNDVDELLKILNEKLEGTTWEKIGKDTVRVTYNQCFCPIMNSKIHTSPVQCHCSVAWLKKNLEIFLNKSVEIELKQSVLRNGDKCEFIVKL